MKTNRQSSTSLGATWVAIITLLLFGFLVTYMLRLIGATDTEWTRSVYIFDAVKTIAVAAAGFLFGREVNRQRAEAAEKRADRNEARGNAGAAIIRAKTLHSEDEHRGTWSELMTIVERDFPTER